MACPGRPQSYSPDGTPWTVRYTSDGRCIDVPAWTPLATAPTIYGSGGFYSENPNALITRETTDAAGRVTVDVGLASTGIIGTICKSNCGAGMGFFGLGGGAAEIARSVGMVAAQILPALTPAGAFITAGSAIAQNVERSQSGMALNLGGILSAVGGVLGNANFGDYSALSQIGAGAFNIAGAALAPPAPSYTYSPMASAAPAVYQPIYQPQVPVVPTAQPMAQPVGAFSVATNAVTRVVAPILLKIAAKLGYKRVPTLRRTITMVRKMAKFLMSPEAVAAALGITAAELATLIVSDNARKRRRMNPANANALRRAARRIKSFHKLCTHTDLIKSRGRRSSSKCGTCRKSPCRC